MSCRMCYFSVAIRGNHTCYFQCSMLIRGTFEGDGRQWRSQEFFFVGVQQIPLRTKGRENGDLGALTL
jgi:hypothetical protein